MVSVPVPVLALSAAGLLFAAPAAAAPECTDVGPNTRLCATAGHTQIVTSPHPAFTGSYSGAYPGWGYGGIGLTLGGSGFWIGF